MSIEIFMSSRMLVIDDDEASRLLCRTAFVPDGHLLSKGVDGNRWPLLRYVFKRLTRRRGLDVIHENMRAMSATVGAGTREITMGKASLKICHSAAAY